MSVMSNPGRTGISFKLLLGAALALGASQAGAAIFSEDFDSGTPTLDWDGGPNFTVTSGSVDLIADNTFGIRCAGNTGGCVDLLGTLEPPATNGTLVSIALNLDPGIYNLSFDYSGNQRQGFASAFNVQIAGLNWDSGFLDSSVPFTHYSDSFTIDTAGSYNLVFTQPTGAGNQGNILDNVNIAAVPEPASWAMMIAGFGLVGGALRRRGSPLKLARA